MGESEDGPGVWQRRCHSHAQERKLLEVSSHLDVIMRVPVRIKDDDSVCSGQIDAQAPSSGGQEEAELLSPRS